MKLIIDIEPRYCKDMQSDIKGLYYEAINRITEAVRNGQPYEERPQGEWRIKNKGTTHYHYCSICNWPGDFFDPYCRHCGARMHYESES